MLDAGKYFLEKQQRSTGISEDELIKMAVKSMGLDELSPFNPNERIIEYLLRDASAAKLTTMTLTAPDAEFNTNTQRAQGYNVNFILWNASISKKFGKGENLIASFVATDMLNQNINTYRTVEDNGISDVKNTIIGRYLLLKVVYKFKNKGAE